MLSLGSLVFASPWMLLSLTTLPIIWWILRITPPPPKIQPFPPLLLMGELNAQEETPAGTPFWLLIFRLLIAAIIICALARPIWNAGEKFSGTGPVVIVIDDGWSAAPNWSRTIRAGLSILDQAEREGRAAILITTAPNQSNGKVEVTGLLRPQDIRKKLKAMQPVPWPKNLRAAANAVAGLKLEGSAQVGYLSDG
ncbi:MAG: BatA domain-containing protein, partial [Alphaproteobacteria bacterium]